MDVRPRVGFESTARRRRPGAGVFISLDLAQDILFFRGGERSSMKGALRSSAAARLPPLFRGAAATRRWLRVGGRQLLSPFIRYLLDRSESVIGLRSCIFCMRSCDRDIC